MLEIIKGNIFTTKCKTIVNTVNCVGVMGAGIALECRLRHPRMYDEYVRLCKTGLIATGKLWLYKPEENDGKWILCFPTKTHWKTPSEPRYLEQGLRRFAETYKQKNIDSIAFPMLGAFNGGIPEDLSLEIMLRYLEPLDDIAIEIYRYDPNASDDLMESFRAKWAEAGDDEKIKKESGIGLQYSRRIREALLSSDIHQLNQLAKVRGIGEKTLEKAFRFVMDKPTDLLKPEQTRFLF